MIGDFLLHIIPLIYHLVEPGQVGIVVLCVVAIVIIDVCKELVIKGDDPLVAPPVCRQIDDLICFARSFFDLIHQVDEVATLCPAEGIDALLGITDDEVLVSTASSFIDEWLKVGPLQLGRVLKLIDHVVVQSHAHTVVDKGGVVSVYDLIKELINPGDEEQVILMLILLDRLGNLCQYGDIVQVVQ